MPQYLLRALQTSSQAHGWQYGLHIDITSTGGVSHFRQRHVAYDELGCTQDDYEKELPVIDTRPNIVDIVSVVEETLRARATQLLEICRNTVEVRTNSDERRSIA